LLDFFVFFAFIIKRLESESYADKVIVTTIQKLGLALDENSEKNKKSKQRGEPTFKERLMPLRDKRMVIIFDECHRSQFGDNHKAIMNFFPKAQLFGFTGTPIFDNNAIYVKADGTEGSYKTTKDVFEKQLHSYTITHAIDDGNVLRFHIDYFGLDGKNPDKTNDAPLKAAVIDSILKKHNAATNERRFNALLATASINDAIKYYELLQEIQTKRTQEDENFVPLKIACVFSPPAEGNKNVQQMQEDLPQEKADNQKEPEKKKKALKAIITDYNEQYGTNHRIDEFDLYYQDVQKRIKDQKYSNSDYPRKNKIDVTIVVDMLLTGFDSQYLSTLYVDKNLKYHGLIQAFSRTNRVLNNTKPFGNIIDYRNQVKEVDEAVKLFSGEDTGRAREIWLVDPAGDVAKKFVIAVKELEKFMKSQGLSCKPEEVNNLKGDIARAGFINKFKEIQRLKTQLDQYTDLDDTEKAKIEKLLPEDTMRSFRSAYIETAQRLKPLQGKDSPGKNDDVDQLDFEYVLFSSVIIDYDYIMSLISKSTHDKPEKQKMRREQLINIIRSSSNLMEDREDIIAYINTLETGVPLNEKEIKEGYKKFKFEKTEKEMAETACKHGLKPEALQTFADEIIDRMIFDGEKLSDLMEPLDLSWKERAKKELKLMEDLIPLLKKLSGGHEIAGLSAYE
jgi:type I restriction enzyme R subunit